MNMNRGFVWDFDPAMFSIGSFEVRWYGLIFVIVFLVGYWFWRWQILRGGRTLDIAQNFFIWGIIAVIAGARLGHCLFYDPAYYLSNPLKILYTREGGLASHGAMIGLIIALVWFARKYKMGIMETLDRFSFSAAFGAAAVRLGNFLNSEIVGRPTDVPWGVRFMRYDGGLVARHPSQIYEFLMGLVILLVLYLADKWAGKEKRPTGLLAGIFMTLYSLGRFVVEYFKERQSAIDDAFLSIGQLLSIIPFFAGIWFLFMAVKDARAK